MSESFTITAHSGSSCIRTHDTAAIQFMDPTIKCCKPHVLPIYPIVIITNLPNCHHHIFPDEKLTPFSSIILPFNLPAHTLTLSSSDRLDSKTMSCEQAVPSHSVPVMGDDYNWYFLEMSSGYVIMPPKKRKAPQPNNMAWFEWRTAILMGEGGRFPYLEKAKG